MSAQTPVQRLVTTVLSQATNLSASLGKPSRFLSIILQHTYDNVMQVQCFQSTMFSTEFYSSNYSC